MPAGALDSRGWQLLGHKSWCAGYIGKIGWKRRESSIPWIETISFEAMVYARKLTQFPAHMLEAEWRATAAGP